MPLKTAHNATPQAATEVAIPKGTRNITITNGGVTTIYMAETAALCDQAQGFPILPGATVSFDYESGHIWLSSPDGNQAAPADTRFVFTCMLLPGV